MEKYFAQNITEHAQKKFIFFLAKYFASLGEIKKRNQLECRKKLKLPTMQKNKQYRRLQHLLFTFFPQITSGAKSVELSFYLYFARNLFRAKNEPWNQRRNVFGIQKNMCAFLLSMEINLNWQIIFGTFIFLDIPYCYLIAESYPNSFNLNIITNTNRDRSRDRLLKYLAWHWN